MKTQPTVLMLALVFHTALAAQAGLPKFSPPPDPRSVVNNAIDNTKKAAEAAVKTVTAYPPPPAPPTPPPPIRPLLGGIPKEQRALLVISTGLTKYGAENLQSLYSFLQTSGARLPQTQLAANYGRILVLDGNRGTVNGFYQSLARLAAGYQAVDVIIHSHGAPNELGFDDGWFSVSDLADAALGTLSGPLKVRTKEGRIDERRLAPIPAAHRNHLRAVYETACFGESHSSGWLKMGFDVAAGAHAVHADSPASFPTFLNWWGAGYEFGEAVAAANRADVNRAYDRWAERIGFSPVDSKRAVRGQTQRISLASQPSHR